MTRYVDLSKLEDSDLHEYFAAQDAEECVSRCIEKIDEYYSEMNRTGRVNLYRNSFFKFYQGFILKGTLYHSGQEGELVNTFVNHYANLITHMVNMVCQQKLAYDPQAAKSDSQAQEQIKLSKGILFQYANRPDIDLDGILRNATEMSCVFMEAYVSVLWNKHLGRTIATDHDEESGDETEIKEGDNEFRAWSPFDVIVDTTLPSNDRKSWVILRSWENKFDVAAEYPNWAQEIVQLSCGANLGDTQLTYSISQESDLIPVYYFFHKKTAAVSKGRLTKFIDDNIILSDGKLHYRRIPMYRIAMRELWGSPYGYSRAADLLPLQETVDRLCSAVLTNELTFATQNILIAKGSSISWESLYGGLNVIEWDSSLGEAGKPSALQLTSSPPEVFNFIKQTVADMGTLAGINEVVRGNPDMTLKGQVSGAAMALMNSNSIQFNSDLQKAYVRLAEQVGTAAINNIQDFAFPEGVDLSREGMSSTTKGGYSARSFKKSDIDQIEKIVIRYANPLSQTQSGRMQIAESLLTNGIIKDAKKYIEVMETGDMENVLRSDEAQLSQVQNNYESLSKGQVPPVGPYDNFPMLVKEACAILWEKEASEDPQVVKAVQSYVNLCLAKWQNLSLTQPQVAALLNIPVLGLPPVPSGSAPRPGASAPSGAQPQIKGPAAPAPNNAGLPQSVPVPTAA